MSDDAPTPKQKGNELEEAVRLIETAILRGAPGFAEGRFTIEGNRLLIVNGVKHEIDVFVTATLAVGYRSVFVFECKNWEAKVGKNEIIVFAEKINVAGAQRGFFVAKSFTQDARAQAAKCDRMELLEASHRRPVAPELFKQFHLLNQRDVVANASIIFAGGVKGNPKPIELRGKEIAIGDQRYEAQKYVDEMLNASKEQAAFREAEASPDEGDYPFEFSDERNFSIGEASLDGKPLEAIRVFGSAVLDHRIGKIASVYEVQSRGRYLTVVAEAGGIELVINVVQPDASNG